MNANDPKLLKIIRALSPKKRRDFLKWAAFHLDGKRLKYFTLLTAIADPVVSTYEPETIWEIAFPELPYDDSKLRRSFTEILKVLKDFLAQEALKEQANLKDLLYIQSLKNFRIDEKLFSEEWKAARKGVDMKSKSGENYEIGYKLEKEKRTYQLRNNPRKRSEEEEVRELVDAFDPWWVHEKLLLAISLKEAEDWRGFKLETPLVKEAISLMKEHKDFEVEMVYLQNLISFFQAEGEVDSGELKLLFEDLKKSALKLRREEFLNIFILISNRANQNFIKTETYETSSLIFDMNLWGIQSGLLQRGDMLPSVYYKNLIENGFFLGKLDETYELMENLRSRLEKKSLEEVYMMSLAKYHFAKGNFISAAEISKKIKPSNIFSNVEARILQIQCEYEMVKFTQEEDLLENLIDSLLRHIYNQKSILGSGQIGKFISFLTGMKNLLKGNKIQEISKIKQENLRINLFTKFHWLSQKAEEKLQNL